MSKKRFQGPPASNYRDGDGLDPRFDPKEGGKPTNRKALQLCRQVERALAYVLQERDDPILQNLIVESVVPAPSTARLLIRVINGLDTVDDQDVEHHLSLGVIKIIRFGLAEFIHRKKMPELSFQVLRKT